MSSGILSRITIQLVRLLLPVLLLTVLLPAQAALRNWAIINAGQGEAAPLCDLLTTELSQVPDITLVEREALKQLTDEQLLSNALSADGVASRLRLGEMLHADALLVLKITGEGDNRVLTVMVIDCPIATRLRIEQLPWKKENVPALSEHLRDLIATVRRQYADGIKRIVGVPNFVSRSFSRSYDPLQESYSLLLQQVLMLEPGVAVIDTGEAQAIGRELNLAGGKTVERILPVMVQGEFRVETPAGAAPAVTLSVKITDKTGAIATADSGPLALEKAPEWITTTLPAKVQVGRTNAKLLPVSEQAKALAEWATKFTKLGSYQESIPLLESALLLNPDLPKERAELVTDYLKIHRDAFIYVERNQYRTAQAEQVIGTMVSEYCKALDHAKYLICHRQFGLFYEETILKQLVQYTLALEVIGKAMELPEAQRPLGMEHLSEAEKAKQQFLLDIIPVIMVWPGRQSGMQESEYRKLLFPVHLQVSEMICSGIARGGITREEFPFIRQAAEAMPKDYLPIRLPDFYAKRGRYVRILSAGDFYAFMGELAKSDLPLIRAVGQYHLLVKRYQEAKGNKEKLLAVQNDLATLNGEIDALPPKNLVLNIRSSVLGTISSELKSALTSFDAVQPRVEQKNVCALTFEKTQWVVSPGNKPVIFQLGFHVLPFEGYDIIWDIGCKVYLHRKAGVLEPLKMPAVKYGTLLLDVVWDGQYFWLLTSMHGILVIDSSGKYLGAITKAEGLPPYDRMGKLHSIAPGKLLAVGISETDKRAWCATITWDAGARMPAVNVFHEGIECPVAADATNRNKYALNPRSTFTEFTIFDPGGMVPGTIGISRLLFQPGIYWHLDPLTIDPTTLKVGIWTPPTGLQAMTVFQPELPTPTGDLLGFDDDFRPPLRLIAISPGKKPLYRPVPVSNPGAVGIAERDANHVYLDSKDARYRTLLPMPDGWIYLAGSHWWWRVDPKTMTAQRLNTQPLPQQYASMEYSVSSVLGLIAWSNGGCYRVTIDETKIPKTGE